MHERGKFQLFSATVMMRHLNSFNCFSFEMNPCGP